jgi:hypothetical protein
MTIRRGIFFLILLALGIPGASSLASPVRLVPHLFVKVDILGVRNKATTTLAKRTIEVSQEKPGVAMFPLDSYRAGDGLTLREIEVRLEAGPAGGGGLQPGIAGRSRESCPPG